jgi:hypothetical protein
MRENTASTGVTDIRPQRVWQRANKFARTCAREESDGDFVMRGGAMSRPRKSARDEVRASAGKKCLRCGGAPIDRRVAGPIVLPRGAGFDYFKGAGFCSRA